MRNVIFCLGLSSLIFLASALKLQQPKVPAAVLKAFSATYSAVEKVVWTKDTKGYEAEFVQNQQSIAVVFNGIGKIIEKETDIPQNRLPKAVFPYLAKNYKAYKITETTLIQKQSLTLFEVELEKGSKTFDLLFDEKGNLWRK